MIYWKTKNRLYRIKSFWLSKKWLEEKPIFSFWRTVFRGHRSIRNEKSSFRLLLPTLPAFIKTVIYSAIIIIILESFNRFFPIQTNFDKNAIDTLLAAIASITGVFLGLYFTAISSIASNFLIRATQDVRRFFFSAPQGQQYVRTVASTGIITIFYIAAKSFGHTIHPVGLMFLSLLVAYVISRFWSVGSGVFNSWEPTHSLPWVTKDIADSIRSVTPPGFQWKKPAIQNHHRHLCTYSLELISNLINFGIKEIKLSDEQLIVALKYLGGLLFFYSDEKGKIPTNSFWYKTKSQYESWTLADSTKIALALNTGTTIQPKTIKDFTWYEEQTLDIGVKILKFLADEKRIGSVFEGFEIFVGAAETYGKDFDEQSIRLLFQKLDKATSSIYSLKTDAAEQQAYKEKLAFVDSQGRLATVALLGLMKYLNEQSGDKLAETISIINWTSDDKSIYLADLPSAILSRLESMATELKNERIIEGKIVSPQWYIETLCVQKYLFSLQNYFNFIKSLHADYFEPKFEKLLAEEQLPFAVQLIQGWLEFSNKYCHLFSLLKKHVEDCARFHRVNDLPWVVFNFEDEEKTCFDRQKEVSDRMISLLPKLKTLTIGDDLPDYFGQALTMGVQACYEACEDNDHERLKKILPAVFDGSLSAYDMMREKVKNWSQEDSKIIFSTESLENFFEISGYAKLYSELYQNPELWNIVQQLWDIYLKAVDAKQVIKFIAGISAYRDTQFTIMPQANLRTNWKMSFERKMREQGFPMFPDRERYDYVNGRRKRPNHSSALIRIIVRWGGLIGMASVRDVFFATYLSSRPESQGIELSGRHNLRENLEREQQEPPSENDADE